MFETEEIEEFFAAGEETFGFLAQVFFKELSAEVIAELAAAEYPRENGNESLDRGYSLVRRYFNFAATDKRTQLACDYARIFLAAGVYTKETRNAIPYESVFTSVEHLVMQEARDEVVRHFRRDGFKVDPELHEPEDHLAFELEYLASMSAKARALLAEGKTDALVVNLEHQAHFIDHHLLNWIGELNEVAQAHAKTTFYPGMLFVAQGALEQTRQTLDDLYDQLTGSQRAA